MLLFPVIPIAILFCSNVFKTGFSFREFYVYGDKLCFGHSGENVDDLEELVNEDMKKFERYMNCYHLDCECKEDPLKA